VIPTTSVSRPQLKSNPMGDRFIRNNSQGNKQDVEEQRRNDKLPKNKMCVTTCNGSLKAKTLNVNSVSSMYEKCVLIDKHDMFVLNPVAKPIKRTVASESNQKPRNITRKLYKRVSKACSWWYPMFIPSGYKWKPKSGKENVNPNLVEIVLFIVDYGCSKHMTGNLKLLINFVEKFLGTVKFGNDQIAPILGYGDLSTCFNRDLKGNDLLTCFRGTDLYSITLQDTNCPNPICLIAKATSSQAWLWHRRLSHLNFDTINLLSKNDIVVGLPKLKFVKDHLCSSYELGKSRDYRAFNKRTRVIMESIHVNFNELPQMASDHSSSDPAPECQTMVVSKSSTVSATDAPNQRQQHTTPLNNHTSPASTCHLPTLEPIVTSSENINQAKTYAKNDQVADDEFINIFCTLYPKDTGFELTAFSDSDHAVCLDSRKSTSGGIQFLGGDKLVSWSSKKHDCTSMSSVEAERQGMRCLTPAELEALANESG
nr:hypothetical protein [Tanacetum cinerariifolium]